jgi:hypothetical protein
LRIQEASPLGTTLKAEIQLHNLTGVGAFYTRNSRYIGIAKTHGQHLGIAVAINLARLFDGLDGMDLLQRTFRLILWLSFAT